jgi:predicted HTH domain antitoxin
MSASLISSVTGDAAGVLEGRVLFSWPTANVPTQRDPLRGIAMQTVNIRQLKTNPSTALAAARDDDMVVVMNRDHPQALLVDLEQLGVSDLPAVRVALAVSLFRTGSVSAGFAARMAGKPLAEMLTLLSSQGLSLTTDGKAAADEARAEMRRARDWLANPAA